MQDLVADQVPLIPLYQQPNAVAYTEALDGVRENPSQAEVFWNSAEWSLGQADPTRRDGVIAYALRRLAIAVPMLAAVSLISYLLLYRAADPVARLRQIPTRARRGPAAADPAAGPRRPLVRGVLEAG